VVAYVLSVAFVFTERRMSSAGVEFGLFVLIGVAALALNQVLLFGLVDGMGMHYALAKIPVTGMVFLFNFAVRKAVLFSAAPRAAAA
jgi:putative flippase GtrA